MDQILFGPLGNRNYPVGFPDGALGEKPKEFLAPIIEIIRKKFQNDIMHDHQMLYFLRHHGRALIHAQKNVATVLFGLSRKHHGLPPNRPENIISLISFRQKRFFVEIIRQFQFHILLQIQNELQVL